MSYRPGIVPDSRADGQRHVSARPLQGRDHFPRSGRRNDPIVGAVERPDRDSPQPVGLRRVPPPQQYIREQEELERRQGEFDFD
jgi:hypothetical protein